MFKTTRGLRGRCVGHCVTCTHGCKSRGAYICAKGIGSLILLNYGKGVNERDAIVSIRAAETHFKNLGFLGFFKKPKKPEKLGF